MASITQIPDWAVQVCKFLEHSEKYIFRALSEFWFAVTESSVIRSIYCRRRNGNVKKGSCKKKALNSKLLQLRIGSQN